MKSIEEITTFQQETFDVLAVLMRQLSERCVLTEEQLRHTIEDPQARLFGLFDQDRLIGCATLCVFHSPTGTKGSIEDVVIAEAFRGQHLGRALVEHLLEVAQTYAPIELHLTSKPHRVAANRLYQSLGFERKETNCYVLDGGRAPSSSPKGGGKDGRRRTEDLLTLDS